MQMNGSVLELHSIYIWFDGHVHDVANSIESPISAREVEAIVVGASVCVGGGKQSG